MPPNPDDVDQLGGYIESLLKAGSGVRNGILTDGVHYFLRRGWARRNCRCNAGRRTVPLTGRNRRPACGSTCTASSPRRPKTSARRRRTSKGISAAAPTRFLAAHLLLQEAYAAHRDGPTVAVKRRLWQDLLQVALGKDAATAGDESRLAVHPPYLHHQPDCSHHAAAIAGRRGTPRRRPAGRAAQRAHPGRAVPTCMASSTPTCSPGPPKSAKARTCGKSPASSRNLNWTQSPREVAPTLYQNVITQEERKRLGEYYTAALADPGNY